LCIDDNNFVDSEENLFHTLKWLTNDTDKRAADNKSIAASGAGRWSNRRERKEARCQPLFLTESCAEANGVEKLRTNITNNWT